jgi:anti-anti-sigma factor
VIQDLVAVRICCHAPGATGGANADLTPDLGAGYALERPLRTGTMDRYRVCIPYREPEGSHPDRTYEAVIEVSARSPAQAKVLATREFKMLADLSWERGARNIQDGVIEVKAAEKAEAPLGLKVSEIANGVAVLHVSGSLDGQTDAAFRRKMHELSSGATRRLIVDLSRLDYMNSTSIGELAAAMRQVELRLASIQPGVLRVLKMVGLDRAIPCFASVELAAASYA